MLREGILIYCIYVQNIGIENIRYHWILKILNILLRKKIIASIFTKEVLMKQIHQNIFLKDQENHQEKVMKNQQNS